MDIKLRWGPTGAGIVRPDGAERHTGGGVPHSEARGIEALEADRCALYGAAAARRGSPRRGRSRSHRGAATPSPSASAVSPGPRHVSWTRRMGPRSQSKCSRASVRHAATSPPKTSAVAASKNVSSAAMSYQTSALKPSARYDSAGFGGECPRVLRRGQALRTPARIHRLAALGTLPRVWHFPRTLLGRGRGVPNRAPRRRRAMGAERDGRHPLRSSRRRRGEVRRRRHRTGQLVKDSRRAHCSAPVSMWPPRQPRGKWRDERIARVGRDDCIGDGDRCTRRCEGRCHCHHGRWR